MWSRSYLASFDIIGHSFWSRCKEDGVGMIGGGADWTDFDLIRNISFRKLAAANAVGESQFGTKLWLPDRESSVHPQRQSVDPVKLLQ